MDLLLSVLLIGSLTQETHHVQWALLGVSGRQCPCRSRLPSLLVLVSECYELVFCQGAGMRSVDFVFACVSGRAEFSFVFACSQ